MLKKGLACLLLLVLLPTCALAAGEYIIPHSNTRDLTREELWEWSYESLGFILNEIFARHGYNFKAGQKYYNYFNQRSWYTPNADSNNSRACYSQMSNLEWRNERLVKDVRQEMRNLGTRNTNGKHYLDYIGDDFDVLSGFSLVSLKKNQKLAVYAAPSTSAYRGGNGKAAVSTNGPVYAAGWESGWLLVMYETNNGSVRVGYVEGSKLKDKLTLPMLNFDYASVTLSQGAGLTDDPAMAFSEIAHLPAGTQVTYLSEYQNRYAWAYVETSVNGQMTRGFIPRDALSDAPLDGLEDDSIGDEIHGSLRAPGRS